MAYRLFPADIPYSWFGRYPIYRYHLSQPVSNILSQPISDILLLPISYIYIEWKVFDTVIRYLQKKFIGFSDISDIQYNIPTTADWP